MRVATTGNDIGKRICEALGLKHTRRIEIVIGRNEAVIVRSEHYPTKEEMDAVEAVMQDYRIMPRAEIAPETEQEQCEFAARIFEKYGINVRTAWIAHRLERLAHQDRK
jgi:hypothetical protein